MTEPCKTRLTGRKQQKRCPDGCKLQRVGVRANGDKVQYCLRCKRVVHVIERARKRELVTL